MRRRNGDADNSAPGRLPACRTQLLAVLFVAVAVAACQPRATPEEEIIGAVRQNDVATVRAWLAAGGDANAKSRNGDPLIYIAAGPLGGSDVTRVLIAGGADVTARGAKGRTPLENAAGWCDVAVLDLLLQAGAPLGRLENPQQAGRIVCQQPRERRARVFSLLGVADPRR